MTNKEPIQYGTKVLVGIPDELRSFIYTISGVKEFFDNGIVQEINLNFCNGATKITVGYVPKAK